MSVWNFNEFQVFEKIFDCTFTKSNDLFNVFYESLDKQYVFLLIFEGFRGGPIKLESPSTPQTNRKDRLEPQKSKKLTKTYGKLVFL